MYRTTRWKVNIISTQIFKRWYVRPIMNFIKIFKFKNYLIIFIKDNITLYIFWRLFLQLIAIIWRILYIDLTIQCSTTTWNIIFNILYYIIFSFKSIEISWIKFESIIEFLFNSVLSDCSSSEIYLFLFFFSGIVINAQNIQRFNKRNRFFLRVKNKVSYQLVNRNFSADCYQLTSACPRTLQKYIKIIWNFTLPSSWTQFM